MIAPSVVPWVQTPRNKQLHILQHVQLHTHTHMLLDIEITQKLLAWVNTLRDVAAVDGDNVDAPPTYYT